MSVDKDGYYVFQVNIPEEFVGKSLNDVRLYAFGQNDFKDSSVKDSFFGILTGLLNYGELTSMTGEKIDSLGGKMLAIGFLQAGQPFSVFLAKLLIALLTGGCNVTGVLGLVSLGGLVAFVAFRRK